MAVHKFKPCFPLDHRDSRWNTAECGGGSLRGFGIGKIIGGKLKLVMNCKVNDECRRDSDCCMDGGGKKKKKDEFVEMMREAWPYFEAYQGKTFVVVVCGEVIESKNLGAILEDISLLHGLGIKFVLVPETHVQIDKLLVERGFEAKYVGGYRITDSNSLKAAMDSAGRISQIIQSKLSPGPSFHTIGRHGDNTRCHDTVTVATGNFLAAKKRGVVEGIDYGATGEVKKINVSRIRERLDNDSVVILNNIGYSSSGEVLNCNTYDVATACALALGAEKLICIIDGPILDEMGHVISFLSLEDADRVIKRRAKNSETAAANYTNTIGEIDHINGRLSCNKCSSTFRNGVGFDHGNGFWSSEVDFAINGQERVCGSNDRLSELAAAAFVCRGGVQRVHLLDGNISGVLLKELFQRDGVGTMVASDLYEETRAAKVTDLPAIRQILRPLKDSNTLIWRTSEELLSALDLFVVVERDGQIIACAALFPYHTEKCGEVAAIAVSQELHGQGQGDKLLEYIEKKASSMGLKRVFLLTTRMADWLVSRGFKECSIEFVPKERRKPINPSHRSKYYMKQLLPDRSRIYIDSNIA